MLRLDPLGSVYEMNIRGLSGVSYIEVALRVVVPLNLQHLFAVVANREDVVREQAIHGYIPSIYHLSSFVADKALNGNIVIEHLKVVILIDRLLEHVHLLGFQGV
jgi:hypothetical protein